MAREYPRFIYSDPKNSKSEGPFIVHLLKPRMIIKVCKQTIENDDDILRVGSTRYVLYLLDTFDPEFKLFTGYVYEMDKSKLGKMNGVMSDARQWLIAQVLSGEIVY